jgi:hypothetical protein
MSAVGRRLCVVGGVALIAIGAYALVHPEHTRGASLILLGLAILELGSNGTTRFLSVVSEDFDRLAPDRGDSRVRRHEPLRPVQPRRTFRVLVLGAVWVIA